MKNFKLTFDKEETVESAITEILKNSRETGRIDLYCKHNIFDPIRIKFTNGILDRDLPTWNPINLKKLKIYFAEFCKNDDLIVYNLHYKFD